MALLALPILLVAPTEPAARAAGEVGRLDGIPQTPELAALRRGAAEAQRSLIAATTAYEASEASVARTVTREISQRRKAQAARQRVEDNSQRVDALVRSSYENAAPPTLSLLLMSGEQDARTVMDAATYLGHVTQGRQDVLREQILARKVADELEQAATQAAAEATTQQRALSVQVTALRSQAAQAQSELEQLMQRLAAEEEARQRAAREQARLQAAARARSAAVPVASCDVLTAGSAIPLASYPNGLIPPAALCPLSTPGHMLRPDAAQAFERLNAAHRQTFGRAACVSDSYRGYEQQVRVYREKPSLAAVPGTSNHGWGLAVDLCGGLQSFGTPEQAWMRLNAGRYGWYHPAWAEPGGSRPEPWHWKYRKVS